MSELAILGGSPVRSRPFPVWPQYLPADAQRLQQVLESRHWGGYPVPSRLLRRVRLAFRRLHGAKIWTVPGERDHRAGGRATSGPVFDSAMK